MKVKGLTGVTAGNESDFAFHVDSFGNLSSRRSLEAFGGGVGGRGGGGGREEEEEKEEEECKTRTEGGVWGQQLPAPSSCFR